MAKVSLFPGLAEKIIGLAYSKKEYNKRRSDFFIERQIEVGASVIHECESHDLIVGPESDVEYWLELAMEAK